uniref:AMP-binding domain-containing protein n=1 Tax=Echinostoma caproni TaxID=27848 RepID=A0A183AQR3_9TREM
LDTVTKGSGAFAWKRDARIHREQKRSLILFLYNLFNFLISSTEMALLDLNLNLILFMTYSTVLQVVQYIGETCRYLVSQPPRPTDRQHQVRLAFGNGLRRETWIEFQKRFNVPRIGELYGATESTASIINSDFTVGAIGFIPQVIKGVYPIYLIKMDPTTEEPLRDPETGLCIECDENEPGQLIGRISKRSPVRQYDGYVSEQASEKKVLRNVFKPGDAWFASGDLLYRDELGYLYFSDRLGDTFRWRGENVSTAEVESVLLKAFPDMTATVYGVPVPKNEGKAGMAALVVDLSKIPAEDERELVDRLYQEFTLNLPTYARPLFLRLCEQIEMTSEFLDGIGFSHDHIFMDSCNLIIQWIKQNNSYFWDLE